MFARMISPGAIALASAMLAGVACVHGQPATQPPASAQTSPADPAQTSGPELWIHGIGDPQRLTGVSAGGVRLILNVRKDLQMAAMRRRVGRLADEGLGLVITIRWQDPNIRKKPVKLDAAPTPAEAKEAADTLLALLNSPEATRMGGGLWVQFYNEVAGGPGTIMPDQADGLYDFATATAARIRSEAPHVKIVGPALTGLDPLDSPQPEGSTGELRRQGLLRAIQWSINNADAIDIHLHCTGGEDVAHQLTQLREALKREGKPDFPLVALEWSPAHFPHRTDDLAGAQQAMRDMYAAMAEQEVRIAAYAAFADTALKDTYEWANLWDANGRPHEPFFSVYKQLAQRGAGGDTPADAPADDQPESEDAGG